MSECDDRGLGGASGGHRGASGVQAGPSTMCYPSLWTHLFAGLVRPVPPPNHSPTRRGERGPVTMSTKVETWILYVMFLVIVCDVTCVLCANRNMCSHFNIHKHYYSTLLVRRGDVDQDAGRANRQSSVLTHSALSITVVSKRVYCACARCGESALDTSFLSIHNL